MRQLRGQIEAGEPGAERLPVNMHPEPGDDAWDRPACWHCKEKPVVFKPCAACRTDRYCGRACQVAHWKAGHKGECAALAAAQQRQQLEQ